MPARTVRVRRLDDGHLGFLDPVRNLEREFEVIVIDPDVAIDPKQVRPALPTHAVSFLRNPIARKDVHGEPS